MSDTNTSGEIEKIRSRLLRLEAEKIDLHARLRALEQGKPAATRLAGVDSPPPATAVTYASPPSQKIALFRKRFAGRTDVFPLRWENTQAGRAGYAPACSNEWVKGTCGKPTVKCGDCKHQAFIPVSDAVIARHLTVEKTQRAGAGSGYVMGVYALLPDETCWFLAIDFDGESWGDDARAFVETARLEGVPTALERSRSGNGAHVWIFFASPVPAREARRLGAWLMTRTMERRPEISFASYDRFFPSQDTMPQGGFGNLIALPFQWQARARGNSIFVDDNLEAFLDQWAYLASVKLMDAHTVASRILDTEGGGLFGGVRLPVADDCADEPWRLAPSRRVEQATITGPLPSTVQVVLADQVYIDRSELPPSLTAQLKRLAAFQNPEFYKAQAMRRPTYDKPRVISCVEISSRHVGLPRGCLDEAVGFLQSHNIEARLEDHRNRGAALPDGIDFIGELREVQQAAFNAVIPHDFGVLAATTAFGKTVVAAAVIAQRRCNALILVHRQELLHQWVERLKTFLSIDPTQIGIIAGGRRKPSGIIDVALIQSLVRKGEVADLVGSYGHLVVDECHHLSAFSFERAVRRAKAYFVLGLSATTTRKDGHHPIIFMQCGPVRHRVDARTQAAQRGIAHTVRLRPTAFQIPPEISVGAPPSISMIYAALARDNARNELIFDDVLSALEAKRSPVVLTDRRDHLEYLSDHFRRFARNLVVFHGGMTSSARAAARKLLAAPEGEERLVLATGRYLGEGFDDARLDTLFLTMPISWKGTLAQYVGRLHREHHGKKEVIVYDYTDVAVPILDRMATKRYAGYRALGYNIL